MTSFFDYLDHLFGPLLRQHIVMIDDVIRPFAIYLALSFNTRELMIRNHEVYFIENYSFSSLSFYLGMAICFTLNLNDFCIFFSNNGSIFFLQYLSNMFSFSSTEYILIWLSITIRYKGHDDSIIQLLTIFVEHVRTCWASDYELINL